MKEKRDEIKKKKSRQSILFYKYESDFLKQKL